jgi:hypothetical protein
MNEQQPYEKRLAEKFQQLPIPDVEPNWQQMKSLLDKRMPRGGAHWKWFTGIGIILIMLFGGTWVITSQNDPVTASNREGVKVPGLTQQGGALDSPAHHSLSKKNDLRQKQNSPPPSSTKLDKQTDIPLSENSNKSQNIEETLPNRLSTSENKAPTNLNPPNSKLVSGKFLKDRKRNNENPIEYQAVEIPEKQRKADPAAMGEPNLNSQERSNPILTDKNQKQLPGDFETKTAAPNFKTTNIVSAVDVPKAIGDSINQLYSTTIFPETKSENAQKQAKKSQKSKDILAGSNKSLAVGLSLPLGFPLGDQKPGPYNINAKPNVISDYVPVPHMQYHINNKLYLQTELQLMNPQYIQPVLLYQQKNEVAATSMVYYNSVYAKKLYYFNIPVGVHYSPFQHFYLGTGLQFSSLLSGVALYEQTSAAIGSTRYDLVSQSFAKFKDDTLSQRIDNSEFRLMLDANYYWRQFTVGLRYNQALSNYVSFRLNPTSPLFQDKNKSLQFYLRYNLWENHKKPASLAKIK